MIAAHQLLAGHFGFVLLKALEIGSAKPLNWLCFQAVFQLNS